MITQELLKEMMTYNPETGDFVWRDDCGKHKVRGKIAGHVAYHGYNTIFINHERADAHRLAFLYMIGRFPHEVDHKNRIRSDNRWCNLREVTHSENMQNRSDNSPFIGVQFHKWSGKWVAVGMKRKGRRRWLGAFKTNIAACYCRHAYNVGVL